MPDPNDGVHDLSHFSLGAVASLQESAPANATACPSGELQKGRHLARPQEFT